MSSQSHVPHCRVPTPGEFNGVSSQSHVSHCRVVPPGEFNDVIPEPRATLQGAATWLIQCHDSRATCHIAGWKNSIRHIENRFSPYFVALMQFGLWWAATFVSSSIHLFCWGILTNEYKASHSLSGNMRAATCLKTGTNPYSWPYLIRANISTEDISNIVIINIIIMWC